MPMTEERIGLRCSASPAVVWVPSSAVNRYEAQGWRRVDATGEAKPRSAPARRKKRSREETTNGGS